MAVISKQVQQYDMLAAVSLNKKKNTDVEVWESFIQS